jgi:hypothetical protein
MEMGFIQSLKYEIRKWVPGMFLEIKARKTDNLTATCETA